MMGIGLVCLTAIILIFTLRDRRSLPAEHQQSFSSPIDNLTCVLFDAKRNLLVAGNATGQVVYWKQPDDRAVTLDRWTAQPLTAMTMTPDGLLIAGCLSNEVFGWDFEENAMRQLPSIGAPAGCIGFRQDRLELILGLSNGVMTIVSPKSKNRHIKSGHRGSVKSIAIDPSGKILVTG
ncbi:MAG: WD40 repeat domain-containing protein, partial [Planctomycetaceae bacterium]